LIVTLRENHSLSNTLTYYPVIAGQEFLRIAQRIDDTH
jgi:hypothetical protein